MQTWRHAQPYAGIALASSGDSAENGDMRNSLSDNGMTPFRCFEPGQSCGSQWRLPPSRWSEGRSASAILETCKTISYCVTRAYALRSFLRNEPKRRCIHPKRRAEQDAAIATNQRQRRHVAPLPRCLRFGTMAVVANY